MSDKKSNFEDTYVSLGLGAVHQLFTGTDISLMAIFAVLELLRNLYALVKPGKERAAAQSWYINQLNIYEKGESVCVRPEVADYVFKDKNISEGERETLLKDANKEAINILKQTGIYDFIVNEIKKEQAIDQVNDRGITP